MIALRWQRQVTDHLEWLQTAIQHDPLKIMEQSVNYKEKYIRFLSANCGSFMKYIAESE